MMIDAPIQQNLGRAKNALQDFLIQKLYIPKVYLDADWSGARVDVLAIDRDGSGDVHMAWLFPVEAGTTSENGLSVTLDLVLPGILQQVTSLSSHFRYVALVCDEPNPRSWIPNRNVRGQSLASDGVGRTGILYVDLTEDNPSVFEILKPERFRSSKGIIELADKFVAEHTANWEVRE